MGIHSFCMCNHIMVQRTHERTNSENIQSQNTITGGKSRRGFLHTAVGAVAAGATIAATSTSATADEEYGQVIDIVEDLGADNTGSEPINDALAEAVEDVTYDVGGMDDIPDLDQDDDGVKIVFPEGEYVIHEGDGGDGFARWSFGDGEEQAHLGKIALEGQGEVVLRPPDGGRHNILTLWGRDIVVENFIVSQQAHDTSSGITAVAEENLLLKDILFDGKVTGDYVETPHWQDDDYDPDDVLDDPKCIIPGLLNEDGEGVIEHVRAPDGVETHSRKGGCWVNFVHTGDLLFKNCEFSNMSDNAIYGSPPGLGHGGQGSVQVENSLFVNNNVTAVRLGSPGSSAENCTVITEPGEIPATPWGAITSRAGWVWYTFEGYYEDMDVIHGHTSGTGIIDHGDNTQDVELAVRNCRMEFDHGTEAIRFNDPGVEHLEVSDLSVTGSGGPGSVINAANCSIEMENLCIHQTAAGRTGISMSDVTGSIDNAVIDVGGNQFSASPTTDVQVTNLHEEGGECPSPSDTHDFDSEEAGPSPTIPSDGEDVHILEEIDEPDEDDPDEDDPDEDDPDEDEPGEDEPDEDEPDDDDDVTDDTDDVDDEDDEDDDVDDDDTDDADDDDGMPGFTGIVTLGALATSAGAMIRRFRSGMDEDEE